MNDARGKRSPHNLKSLGRTLPGQIVLVLQGGGALGAYQAGVYQALHEAGIEPDWIIGTSIGAINASLIAGNAPQNRLSRLREFWKRMEQNPVWSFRDIFPGFNEKLSYWSTVTNGIPGFFRPNPLAHAGDSYPLGADRAGYYSTAPLEQTLGELIRIGWHGSPAIASIRDQSHSVCRPAWVSGSGARMSIGYSI
jgi:NTE family protein